MLNEQGWHRDATGGERDKAHAADDRAERARMMRSWADYLGELRTGAEVTPFRRRVA